MPEGEKAIPVVLVPASSKPEVIVFTTELVAVLIITTWLLPWDNGLGISASHTTLS